MQHAAVKDQQEASFLDKTMTRSLCLTLDQFDPSPALTYPSQLTG